MRAGAAGLLALAPLLLAACGGQQSALDPQSDASETIADLWWLLFAISAVVFAVVLLLVLLAVARRRPRTAAPPRDEPLLGRVLVLGAGAAVPAAVLVALFAVTVSTLPAVSAAPDEGELTVEVEGNRWFWKVRYPEQGFETANELHVPVGTPVELRLTTGDVIHSFWAPSLNRKLDLVPGRTSSLVLEADRPGVYRGQCAEFCGVQHANMAFLVIAEEPAAFQAWLERMARAAPEPTGEDERRGLEAFLELGCGGCHTIAGTEASGTLGPDLTHLQDRRFIAAGAIPNTPENLAEWIAEPQHVKPGNRMPSLPLSTAQLDALVAYLETLE